MFFQAIYSDKTTFEWNEDTQIERAYPKIDRTKLVAFAAYDNGGRLVHKLHLLPSQRLIVRRRTRQKVIMSVAGDMTPAGKESIVLIGYQETIEGKYGRAVNRQAITLLFEDGHTELISEWTDGWLKSPVLMNEEK